MYLNTKKHYLSKAICISSLVGLVAQVLNALARIIFTSKLPEPDMLNSAIFGFNVITQVLVIAFIFIIFILNIRKVRHLINIINENDVDEVAVLQKQYIPDSISTLRGEAIYQLLEIWAVILLFVQTISLVSNYKYRNFVSDLYDIIPMDNYENAVTFSAIYNSTHGFKYIGMFSAIVIGIFVTAVFLKDRFLKVLTVFITGFFVLAFTIFQMVTFYTELKIISIVWTSVIYHGLETIGLIFFSIYLAKHYKGL